MGKIQLVLHAHLPFIKHPEHESFFEETWLFEAISESYTPLLRMLHNLDADGIPANITISFSPSLTAMLKDELLQERYVSYVENLIELGEKEVRRTQDDPQFNGLARMYLDLYRQNLDFFLNQINRDLLSGFDYHQKKGNIEIITSPGTYPFLPFYEQYPANIHAHIEAALDSHREIFSRASKGIWLPECGYYPGLEEILKEHGLHYFFVEAHGLLFAKNCPTSGTYAPVQTPAGPYAFARDVASVNRVWSDIDGYPGEVSYRDFYRDIGHDLDFDYIKPYIHLEEFRVNTGYKYYAITGNTVEKQPYQPEQARGKIAEHADNFLYTIRERLKTADGLMDGEALITAPFSAELFGHWWFEGVQWLEQVVRRIHADGTIGSTTPGAFLEKNAVQQTLSPVFSSWGNKGYAEVWLNGANDWIYRHLHSAIEHMQELVERFPNVTGLKKRALNQAAREVLLAQTVDWSVIMRSGVSEEYARARIREHIGNFYFIYESLGQGNLGTEWLTRIEKKNNIFPAIDYRTFEARRSRDNGRMGHPYVVTDQVIK